MSKNILPTNGEWIPNVPLAPAVGSFHDLCEFAGWKDSRVRAYLEDPGTNPGKNSDAKNSWEVYIPALSSRNYVFKDGQPIYMHPSIPGRGMYICIYIYTHIPSKGTHHLLHV